jgi:hypothetical protein
LKGIIQKNGGIVEGSIDMSIENPVYSKYDWGVNWFWKKKLKSLKKIIIS